MHGGIAWPCTTCTQGQSRLYACNDDWEHSGSESIPRALWALVPRSHTDGRAHARPPPHCWQFPAPSDLDAFDRRENGYQRVEVPLEMVELLSWQCLPSGARVFAYVPYAPSGALWWRQSHRRSPPARLTVDAFLPPSCSSSRLASVPFALPLTSPCRPRSRRQVWQRRERLAPLLRAGAATGARRAHGGCWSRAGAAVGALPDLADVH